MFSKLRGLAKFRKPSKSILDISSIKNNLTTGLFDVMEGAFEKRKSDSNNSNYTEADVDKIINQYARKNMIIAAASSIVPGPFGVLGSIPELLLNFNNQMNMIYDLGCAHNKENFINKDLLLDIPIAAFGGNTNLSALQGASNLLDSPQKVLTEKAAMLGKSVIEKTLKKSIVQFIPVAGPVLMGIWSKTMTKKISKGSLAFLDQSSVYVENVKPEESEAIKKQLMIEKIKGLANLIEANNDINEGQMDLIGTIIANSGLANKEKEYYLKEALKTGSNFQLDFELLKNFEEKEDLIMEMIIMAKRSGHVDNYEKEYIYKVGSDLQIERLFLDELFE